MKTLILVLLYFSHSFSQDDITSRLKCLLAESTKIEYSGQGRIIIFSGCSKELSSYSKKIDKDTLLNVLVNILVAGDTSLDWNTHLLLLNQIHYNGKRYDPSKITSWREKFKISDIDYWLAYREEEISRPTNDK